MKRLKGQVIAKTEPSAKSADEDGLIRLTIRVPKEMVTPDGKPLEGPFRFGDGLGIPERYSAQYISDMMGGMLDVKEGDESLFYDQETGFAVVGLDVATIDLLQKIVEKTEVHLDGQFSPDEQLQTRLNHLKACLASEELTKELIAKYNVYTLLTAYFSGLLTPQEVADAQGVNGLHSNRNKTYTVVNSQENEDSYDMTIDVATSGRWVELDMLGEEPPVHQKRGGLSAAGLRQLDEGAPIIINAGVKRKKDITDPPLFEAVDENLPLVLITQGGACGMMLQALRERDQMDNPAPISLYVALRHVTDLPDKDELLEFLSKDILKSLHLAISAPREVDEAAHQALIDAGVTLHVRTRLPVEGMAEDVQSDIGGNGKVILSGIKPFVFAVKDALGVPETQIQFTKAPDRANENAPIQGIKPTEQQVAAATREDDWVQP